MVVSLNRVAELNNRVLATRTQYQQKLEREQARERIIKEFKEEKATYLLREKAHRYLSLLQDDDTKVVRDFLEGVINRSLDVVFGEDLYRFHLEVDKENSKVSLILSEKMNGEWQDLDIKFNTGEGMAQVIAVLFSIVLVEITDHRMFFVIDESLGGLHQHAVQFIQQCVRQFAKHGGQFVFIEYTFEEFGRQIDIERDNESTTSRIVNVTDFEEVVA